MPRFWSLILVVFLLVPALAPVSGHLVPFGGAREYVEDLRARRAAVMDALGAEAVLVLWSAPPRVYSDDTDYEYRQETNLLYLTGLEEQGTTLVLVPGETGPREFLFVRARDPFRELWNGAIPSADAVTASTGIAHVFPQRGTEAFDAFMRGLLGAPTAPPAEGAEAAGRAAAPTAGSLRLMILENPERPTAELQAMQQVAWAKEIAEGRADTTVVSARPVLERQRRIKTAYEQRVLARSVEIAAEAHVAGMKVTRPGRWEYEVEAAIEHWFLSQGAMSWGYPSIVGSGPNATTLHYNRSTRQMQDGELLLVDAGANFQGLTGDITRTWPINGRFTDDQRALYEVVLEALQAGIEAARPGASPDVITRATRSAVGRGLLRLGLATDASAASGRSTQVDLWFPHSPYHGIGMDVHEMLGTLDPGVAFTIEPGIYVRPDTLERLAMDPDQADVARTLRPAVERFANMGIRIEETVLMTPDGLRILSSKAPRAVAEIEAVVGSGQ